MKTIVQLRAEFLKRRCVWKVLQTVSVRVKAETEIIYFIVSFLGLPSIGWTVSFPCDCYAKGHKYEHGHKYGRGDKYGQGDKYEQVSD